MTADQRFRLRLVAPKEIRDWWYYVRLYKGSSVVEQLAILEVNEPDKDGDDNWKAVEVFDED
jgi:hypothetical protein